MALILRYSTTLKGNMRFIGNSLGLSQLTNALEPGTEGNLGAFISLDLSNKVNTFPNGTTLDYLKNGSSATLNLPIGSTVIRAELIWGGLYAFNYTSTINPAEPPSSKSIFNLINNPILFNGIHVTPTSITAQEHSFTNPSFGSFSWYIRSADVTTIVQNNGGSGTYSVQQVPGLIEKISNYTSRTNHLGWTLAVIYKNPLEEYTNAYLYVGANNITISNNTDLTISGFETLPTGTINSKLFLSTQEGDGNIVGDQVSFGTTFSNLTNLSGPNNPSNNFFAGQINNVNGTLDTSGTFGLNNNIASTGTNTSASRHGWDITTINISSLMTNSQTSAALRLFSQGDGYMINTVGLTTNSVYLDISLVKSVDKNIENIGNKLTYSFNITNNSNVTITSNILTDILQAEATFITGTVKVNSTSLPLVTPLSGIPIPDLITGASATISFNVLINNMPIPNIIYNTGTLSFKYGGATSPQITSNKVQTIILKPFICDSSAYRVAVTSENTNSSFFQINLVTGLSVPIKSDLGAEINAIGFNPIDNLIYGIEVGTSNLYVLDSLGNSVNYGSIPNLPIIDFETGAVDEKGRLFIRNNSSDTYYVIDVNTTSPNFKKLLDPTTSFSLQQIPYGTQMTKQLNFEDWAFNLNDGYLYSITSDTNKLVRINPLTGFTSLINILNIASGSYSSLYSSLDNYIYAINDSTGKIYRINTLQNPTSSELFSQNFSNIKSDGANCPYSTLNLDFGDAPDISSFNSSGNYSTRLINNGPRHQIINDLFIGSSVTSENDALQNFNATGDTDDGFSSSISINTYLPTYSLTIPVTNITGSSANLYAWIDYNKDGIFQTNEGVFATIPSLSSLQNITLTFNNPISPVFGTSFLRIRITTDSLLNFNSALPLAEDTRSIGPASNGEVEDYIVNFGAALDFGDAPDTDSTNYTNNYSTLLANNGPRHAITNTLFLGSSTTFEIDALQNAIATGDIDNSLTLPLEPIEYGSNFYTLPLSYINNTGKVAYIYAWIDSNLNGIFELSEALVTSIPSFSNNALQNISLKLPLKTYCHCASHTFLRLRITTDTLINSNGLSSQEDTRSLGFASDGEVEDYKIDILCFSVSGIVFNDLNKNGLFDNLSDILLENITIAIFSSSTISLPFDFTTTDINGSYSFNNLPKDSYFIKIYYPNNYSSTLYDIGNDATIKSNILENSDTSLLFTLDKTNIHQIINAGICIQNLFNISGFVFYDCNGDGVLNVNEALLNNATIDLYQNSTLITSTLSGILVTGYYEFKNLKPGNYTIVINSINGLNLTSLNTTYYGSKFEPSTNTASILLTNQSIDNVNAGFKGTLKDTLKYCSCESTIPSCYSKCNFY
ncbi:MAG: SdrD B-like domain-containing protein [Sarcina sp.]